MLRSLACQRRCVRALNTSATEHSTAVVFGGFGFTQRQISKHEAIYREHGFNVLPVLSKVPQLITPVIAAQRAADIAQQLQEADQPTVVHMVSGSFWTGMYMLAHLEKSWRDRNIKAIMFDSCPPKSDVYAFGGWLSWLLKIKTRLPSSLTKPLVSHLFHPVRPFWCAARLQDAAMCLGTHSPC